jgi:EmrB/QacA subfamily drug resistance transporter
MLPPAAYARWMLAGSRRWTLGLLCLASFVAVADTTIVSIALPALKRDLDLSATGAPWVLNAYALVFGGLLLLSGRLGDLYGRRRLFEVGLVVFVAGSALAGVAAGPAALLVGRFLQGTGAAAFVPASLALLTATFTEAGERGRALGAYGAMAALGFVVGMVGGGVITELWGWRWVFLVNVPVAVAMLVGGATLLRESRDAARSHGVDVQGAMSATGGLVLVIYAMTSVPQHGWWSAQTLVPGALGIALLLAFLVVEARHPNPLVPLEVVRRKVVLVPNGAVALQSMIGIAWLYILTLYFQDVLHHGPLRTGLLFAPMTVASVVASPVAGRMAARHGARTTATIGLVLVGVGLGVMTVGVSPTGPVLVVVAGMVVGEAGFMLSSVSLTLAGTSGLDDDRSGLAAGLLNTSMQLGSGWGLGVVAVVVAGTLSGASDGASYAAALRGGLLACLVFCALALALVGWGLRRKT